MTHVLFEVAYNDAAGTPGTWLIYASSPGEARLLLAELLPGAAVTNVSRRGEW